jgi:UDP-N-acetylmuramoyl-tripeptide--D-alanyl-D-alanine ligase
MLNTLKRSLYFLVAGYFRFWAAWQLKRWQPKVIVVTGSAGKTTLLHLLEAQLGERAHYSHHANSAYGISFDILGLSRVSRSRFDWLMLLARAPFQAFRRPYAQRYYVAEVDADRSHEAAFIARLLRPAITLWVSSLHTHTAGFDKAVQRGKFRTVEEAVAHEYGSIVAATTELVLFDGDNLLMQQQMSRTKAKTEGIRRNSLKHYKLSAHGTALQIGKQSIVLPAVVPKATFMQVAMVSKLLNYVKLPLDASYSRLIMPPGRSSILRGKQQTTLLDSTYNNSNIDSMREVIEMYQAYPAKHKWAVLGDMLEQGIDEAAEHAKLATILNDSRFERLILVGKRLRRHTQPLLKSELKQRSVVVAFDHPTEVKEYLDREVKGGETILFKGVGYLEGVIESWLVNPADQKLLVRREPMAAKRRREFGL